MRFTVICTLIALCSGCGSAILRDDFDADALNQPPAESPPGDPVGDLVYLSSPSSGSAVVVSAPAGLSGRSLEYRNVNVPTYNRYLGFVGKEITPSSVEYWAAWVGIPQLSNAASALDVWIGNSHFLALGGIRFNNGQIFRQAAGSSYVPIGTYTPGQRHTVIIKVDKAAQTYVISVFGGQSVSTGTQTVLNPGALSTLRPSVYFWFSEESSSTSKYVIDDITITEACPESGDSVGACT